MAAYCLVYDTIHWDLGKGLCPIPRKFLRYFVWNNAFLCTFTQISKLATSVWGEGLTFSLGRLKPPPPKPSLSASLAIAPMMTANNLWSLLLWFVSRWNATMQFVSFHGMIIHSSLSRQSYYLLTLWICLWYLYIGLPEFSYKKS